MYYNNYTIRAIAHTKLRTRAIAQIKLENPCSYYNCRGSFVLLYNTF